MIPPMLLRSAVPLLAAGALLAACGQQDSAEIADAMDMAGEGVTVSGALFYRERIALPPDAVMVAELRAGEAADAPLAAEQRAGMEGAQPPAPFALRLTPAPDAAYVLRGAFLVGGEPAWRSAPVRLGNLEGDLNIGDILLTQIAPPPPLVGRGNEPFWSVSIGRDEIVLHTDLGETRISVPTPAPEAAGDVTRYVTDDMTVSVAARVCADTMSGMPYPFTVTVTREGETLSGCGGEPAALLAGEWIVEDIGGAGVIDNARATLDFGADGRLSGEGSCNPYTASYTLTGESLDFSPAASGRRACAEAIMEQERRFFAALDSVARFRIADDGALLLDAIDDRAAILARRAQ